MSRYIDADEAKAIYLSKSASEQLDRVPTADVAEVRHGHWIGKQKRMYACNDPVGEMVTASYICSECGIESRYRYNYCSNCGARMDGEKK